MMDSCVNLIIIVDFGIIYTFVGGFCLGVSPKVAQFYDRECASNYEIYYKKIVEPKM